MKINKAVITSILFVISFLIFIVLDVGMNVEQASQIIQPLFFALVFVVTTLFTGFRKYILIFSLALLFLLIIAYLFGRLSLSDWIGRLGFGILFLTIFSYIPELVKKGHIEKF